MPPIDTKQMEEKWLKYWEDNKIYSFDKKSKKKIYSIDTPPPTVSGAMHMGHAFSYSQEDFIARYKRMAGFNVFYPFGTDDNGLPTEKLIQNLKNVKSTDFSRYDFIKLCLETLKEITPKFIQDWKNLGVSCDYNIYYSTINRHSQKISQKSFIDLYEKGLIYKEEFPTIWDTVFQTPVAQAELEDKELPTLFSTLKFTIGNLILPIATTRPELLGACVAVFVNPKDKRYKKLIGKKAKVPIFNHEVPIIADESADIEKGTGVLMICSYGDKYDVDAIKRHKLSPKVVLNKDGTLNINPYKGLSIKEARKKILEDLKSKNLIIEQKQISHIVNVFEKSGNEIEFIPTEQWFIKILDKKKQLISQGNKISWFPEFMFKRYQNWINGLDWDWSISRERHFGIPIPAWICPKCKSIILPKESELPIDPVQIKKTCPICNCEATPETKVLDTWATSSLTPQIASALVDNKIKIPYNLRPQAHDIIRTWAFYTIVKSLYHNSSIPWKDITISGFVTLGGEKMSKSKGNVIKPQDIMEKYGSDALRFWAASSKLGDDMAYQEKDLVTGNKFITKLFNASRFVFMNLSDFKGKKPKKLEKLDELFLQKLSILVNDSTKNFDNYEYSKVKSDVERFFWKDFCDNYLELVKGRVYKGSGDKKLSAQYTLYKSLLTIIKLLAPIMPFITEEIYQNHFKKTEKEKSIHLSEWPKAGKEKSKGNWEKIKEIIFEVRQFKSDKHLPLNAELKSITLPTSDYNIIKPYEKDILNISGACLITLGKEFSIEFPKAGTETKP